MTRLAYPPTAYGEAYVDSEGNEHEWSVETLRELAIELTVDANGNIPTDDLQTDFDAWLLAYNTQGPHLGYRNMGRCPIETVSSFTSKLSA